VLTGSRTSFSSSLTRGYPSPYLPTWDRFQGKEPPDRRGLRPPALGRSPPSAAQHPSTTGSVAEPAQPVRSTHLATPTISWPSTIACIEIGSDRRKVIRDHDRLVGQNTNLTLAEEIKEDAD
jgi:hypothetical protein